MEKIIKNQQELIFLVDEDVDISVSAGQLAEVWALYRKPGHRKVNFSLRGAGARVVFTGLVFLGQKSSLLLETSQIHTSGKTKSDVLVKSVLNGQSRFDFSGRIRIGKKANLADALQRNDNLLLGSGSAAASAPQLEILTDDVRCTHAATVRPVSGDIAWYLGTRGIPAVRAGFLEAAGFIRSVTSRAELDRGKITIYLDRVLRRAIFRPEGI